MRAAVVLAVLAAVSVAMPAEAATRRKHKQYPVITVKPRSFLDAGKEVPVGSMSHYVYDMMPNTQAAQLYPGRIHGDQPLPARDSYRGVAVDIRAPAFLAK